MPRSTDATPRHLLTVLLRIQLTLPLNGGAQEQFTGFWVLDSMWKFENISFSTTVGVNKYLTCADCEHEVVGVQRLDETNRFYVAYSLVSYNEAAADAAAAAAAPVVSAETLRQLGLM